MCSTPKSSRSRSIRSHRSSIDLNAVQLARFTVIANAADDRRQAQKAQKIQLKVQGMDSQPHKTIVQGWRYWMLEACLFTLFKQKLLKENTAVKIGITGRKL